jgi:hypothetical protein
MHNDYEIPFTVRTASAQRGMRPGSSAQGRWRAQSHGGNAGEKLKGFDRAFWTVSLLFQLEREESGLPRPKVCDVEYMRL